CPSSWMTMRMPRATMKAARVSNIEGPSSSCRAYHHEPSQRNCASCGLSLRDAARRLHTRLSVQLQNTLEAVQAAGDIGLQNIVHNHRDIRKAQRTTQEGLHGHFIGGIEGDAGRLTAFQG